MTNWTRRAWHFTKENQPKGWRKLHSVEQGLKCELNPEKCDAECYNSDGLWEMLLDNKET
jgi:hypothetical protein